MRSFIVSLKSAKVCLVAAPPFFHHSSKQTSSEKNIGRLNSKTSQHFSLPSCALIENEFMGDKRGPLRIFPTHLGNLCLNAIHSTLRREQIEGYVPAITGRPE